MTRRVLCVGDIHAPYVDEWRMGRVRAAAKDLRPDTIVQIGDVFDFQNWSRYDTTVPGMEPEEELQKGYRVVWEFWRDMRKAAPKAELHQMKGNHCVRVLKHAMRRAPNLKAVLEMNDYRDLWCFPEFGVHTAESDRTVIEIDSVAYHHGHRMKLGDHALSNLQHTVVGHTHRGGLFYRRFRGDVSLFELNCGYIADDNSPAMDYRPTSRSSSVPGFGFIDADGPHFFPL